MSGRNPLRSHDGDSKNGRRTLRARDMAKSLIADLVVANRILFSEGVLDGFGHASVRDERNPERFRLARSMAAGPVAARDIMEFDLDGAPVDARGRAVFLEPSSIARSIAPVPMCVGGPQPLAQSRAVRRDAGEIAAALSHDGIPG